MSGCLGIITENNIEIPMRDGVMLRANVFRPASLGMYPAILIRTPYSKDVDVYAERDMVAVKRFVRSGYIIFIQDSRGRYESEGDYIPFYSKNVKDPEDGYDTIEWIAKQKYCNGKIGTMGRSYDAWMQWMLAKLRPPHLVAMCACSISLELKDVDWPGVFRPGRRVRWLIQVMSFDINRRNQLQGPTTFDEASRIWNETEQGMIIGLIPWTKLPRYLPAGLSEYVNKWLYNPNEEVWKFKEAHKEIEVPNLDISGWFDHIVSTIDHLTGMQKNARTEAARKQTKLILGPWNHYSTIGIQKYGEIDFGPQAELDIVDIEIRWFDFWLKGLKNGIDKEPPVRYFVMGANKWKTSETWPPKRKGETIYYLGSNGKANKPGGGGWLKLAPSRKESCDSYDYDPGNPVPTLWSHDFYKVPTDRRSLEYRSDILYYQTSLLNKDIEIAGYPEAVIYASSSSRDTDFFIWLVDEFSNGLALEICNGMIRARWRNSVDFEREELLNPGEVTEFRIKLGPTSCRFLKGHRIRLEITSSDFPNYDRNHNIGRNDLSDSEMIIANQKIFCSQVFLSRLILPIAE